MRKLKPIVAFFALLLFCCTSSDDSGGNGFPTVLSIRERTEVVNEITGKLQEVLSGIVSKSTIQKLLDPRFKQKKKSEAQKKKAKIRQDGTPALKLITDMFGAHIKRAFGPGIFGRLEREMFDKAKAELMASEWWINKVKDELRDDIRAEILVEMGEAPLQMVSHGSQSN